MVRNPQGRQIRLQQCVMFRVLLAIAAALTSAAILCCGTHVVPTSPIATAEGGTGGDGDTGDDGGTGDDDSGTRPELACLSVGKPATAGTVDSPDVAEASGIVASAVNTDVYWVHNDSGDVARAFALSREGKLLATLRFDTVKPRDIEDTAIEDESPDRSALYFGDIGDNEEVRKDLTIHRVVEPKLGADAQLTAISEKMTVTYPDGPHNAETLLFDPTTKDLLIATKKAGGPSFLHRIGPFAAGKTVKTEKIAEVDIDLATGGEISRDGRYIAIRNYTTNVFVWGRTPGESVADALARPPCKLPVAKEPQGEAFAFLADTKGFVTISEGASPALHISLFE